MYWFLCFILLMGVRADDTSTSASTIGQQSTTRKASEQSTPAQSTPAQTTPAQTTPAKSAQKPNSSETKPVNSTLQNPTKTEKAPAEGNKGDCFWFICEMKPKLAVLIIGALLMTCIILLTATLLLACKVCCTKRQVLDTTKSTPRRLSVDGESAPMINEIRKPEGDENHSGPEEQEKLEEPEKPIEEAAEAIEVSNQASMEDPTLEDPTLEDLTAAESPPNQECEASETIIFDDAEQP
ncbi:uncharacterized protein LOC118824837 [Colossoma macropomum]|uniref:uncharacterized protein LOC118824837 n=1 Tax=Colossoma macropomum TaxID=42526 RepID=UPI00186487A5|nr:uncharacterized protein LOC118824837 [Colossoma macropomum]